MSLALPLSPTTPNSSNSNSAVKKGFQGSGSRSRSRSRIRPSRRVGGELFGVDNWQNSGPGRASGVTEPGRSCKMCGLKVRDRIDRGGAYLLVLKRPIFFVVALAVSGCAFERAVPIEGVSTGAAGPSPIGAQRQRFG